MNDAFSVKDPISMVPPLPAFTTGGWFWGGGSAVQLIAKSAWPTPPAGTLTERGLLPLTAQFDATSESPTV